MLRKAPLLRKPVAESRHSAWLMPMFRCHWVAFLIFFLLVSCRKPVPENILLPYAKKKFCLEAQTDSMPECRDRIFFLDTAAPHLRPFLWLESNLFDEDRQLWIEKQHQASDRYLNMISYRNGKKESSLAITWKNLRIVADSSLFHKVIPVCLPSRKDTLPLHLFYRENSFENGQNPTVLMPYDEYLHAYMPPPESFFETGGILAVLGEPKHVIIRDSSRFFAKADSLARWIWRDTAQASMHRRNYRNFRRDSLMAAKYTKISERDLMPFFEPEHLIMAANLLVASMYTTPGKMALFAVENGNHTAEQTLWRRNDLFRAAVFDLRPNTVDSLYRCSGYCHSTEQKTAILMNDTEHRRITAAFMQDRMQRKTGQYPFLLVETLTPEDAWRFMLYHIAQEEGVVEVR